MTRSTGPNLAYPSRKGLTASHSARSADDTAHLPLLFILEDNPSDIRRAADVGRQAGFTEFETTRYASSALVYLEKAMSGSVPAPNAILIDLDLGVESGFELLRFWHSTPQLKPIPLIVLTATGEHNRRICTFFGVHSFVSKDDNSHVLLEALAKSIRDPEKAAAI
jgi:CheY-like chemotaxis protein